MPLNVLRALIQCKQVLYVFNGRLKVSLLRDGDSLAIFCVILPKAVAFRANYVKRAEARPTLTATKIAQRFYFWHYMIHEQGCVVLF